MTSLEYTYSLDKISCVKTVWYAHVAFALLVVCSGIGCLVTRMIYKHLHVYFGRLYIICMLWCMGTSLVVHNTGLPIAVLLSFIWVLGGLTIGWILIKLHQGNLEKKVSKLFKTKVETQKITTGDIESLEITAILQTLKMEIQKTKPFRERMLSYKAAHGTFMFMSFINIFGRIFGVNLSEGFTCHTFPYYKQLDSPKFKGLGQPLTHVPIYDAHYDKLPWAHGLVWWGVEFSIGPIIFALIIGCAVAWVESRRDKNSNVIQEKTVRSCLSNIRIAQLQNIVLKCSQTPS